MKTIAIDIDNVLNNFSDILRDTVFPYDEAYGLTRQDFESYLGMVKEDAFLESDLLTTKFSDFRFRIHEQCYSLAQIKPDSMEFMSWLKENQWQIVICTKRDLRLTGEATKRWLAQHRLPYDVLCMTANKITFCKLWDIPILIDDDPLNILYGELNGITVYYPIMPKHEHIHADHARGFHSFQEIKQWIKK